MRYFSKVLYFSFILVFFSINIVSAESNGVTYPFDRLFTTEEERRQLDLLRLKMTANSVESSSDSVQTESSNISIKSDSSIRLSGIVVRDDGHEQVWVNGKSLLSHDGSDIGFNIYDKNSAYLKIEESDKKARLKVGEKWYPREEKIIDIYKSQSAIIE